MTLGMSTRAVGAPQGTMGQYAPAARPMKIVPLSVFFLQDEEGEEEDEDGLYGLTRKKKKRREPLDPKDKGKKGKRDATSKGGKVGGGGQVAGGDAKVADAATSGRQSTATQTPQESVTMATGTPLISPGGTIQPARYPGGASKIGLTRAMTGATSTGNVAQVPIPIGAEPIRRTGGKKGKRKKRKKKQESRDRWIQRLGLLMQA